MVHEVNERSAQPHVAREAQHIGYAGRGVEYDAVVHGDDTTEGVLLDALVMLVLTARGGSS